MRSRRMYLAGVACVAMAALVGCGGSSGGKSGSSDGGTAASGGSAQASIAGKKVYLVSPNGGNVWAATFAKSTMAGLSAGGAKVTWLQDPLDASKQVSNMNTAIAARPDLILVLPIDANAMVPSLARAKAAGIQTIAVDEPPPAAAQKYVAHAFVPNFQFMGETAGKQMLAGLKKAGHTSGNIIAIIGTSSSSTAETELHAFEEVIKTDPSYKLVAVEDSGYDQLKAQQLTRALIAKYASKGGIVGMYNDAANTTLGMVQAAQQTNTPLAPKSPKGAVIATAGNCFAPGIQKAIADGQVQSTVTQTPAPQGTWTAQQTTSYLKGSLPAAPQVLLATHLARVVTQENAAQFKDICQ